MRWIRAPENFRDNFIDSEIVHRLVDGVLVAAHIPDATDFPFPPAQFEPVHTGRGEAEEGYTKPFIPLSFSE